jgi:hypothetical protein
MTRDIINPEETAMTNELENIEINEKDFYAKDHDIMELFHEDTFKEKWQRVFRGLKKDHTSGDYKYAILQMTRLSGPVAAVIVPILLIGIILICSSFTPVKETIITTKIIDPTPIEKLEKIEKIKPEKVEPPDPTKDMMGAFSPELKIDPPTLKPPTEFSPEPNNFNAVIKTVSPIAIKGIYSNRTPGAIGAAVADNGGNPAGQASVFRTLRWLKKYQNEDGSWDNATGGLEAHGQKAPAAHTAIGLLTFLAHGDTPASVEFGETVEKAIRYLVDAQLADGTFKGKDAHNYTQPIVAYALAEAFSMTKVPMLKDSAEKAIQIVIDGQHPNGGWDYNCKQSERDDTSYMGWCAQAIKAAWIAELENEGLGEIYKNTRNGFKKNFKAGSDGSGGFGYTGGGKAGGLSGVGVLCMQLTGAATAPEVKQGLLGIKRSHVVSWNAPKGTIYYWYYDTQAMFHTGGEMWDAWNHMFSNEMTDNQTVISNAAKDPQGRDVDIGYWLAPGGKAKHTSIMFDTALCALSLEVYYRYLPGTGKLPVSVAETPDETKEVGVKILFYDEDEKA